jgi:hypothetical protein
LTNKKDLSKVDESARWLAVDGARWMEAKPQVLGILRTQHSSEGETKTYSIRSVSARAMLISRVLRKRCRVVEAKV